MFRKELRKMWRGFTLVELLVVLVIVGILAAVATPLYLQNTKKAKASEAVATMGLLRQAERDFKANRDIYFDVASNKIQNPLPLGSPGTNDGLTVDVGVPKYFSSDAYTVDAAPSDTDGAAGLFVNPPIVDFVVKAGGSASVQCASGATASSHCATAKADVQTYNLEMDNSGRTFVCYGSCTTTTNWGPY